MSLLIETLPGVPDGMSVVVPAHEIKDTQARYLQDILVHQPGLTLRRGPLTLPSGVAQPSEKVVGIVQTRNPQGSPRIGYLHGATAKLAVYSTDFSGSTDVTWTGSFSTTPYTIVSATPALGGGTLIGTSSQYSGSSTGQALGIWRGAGKPNYTTGTVTVTQGSTSVTGSGTSWTANADAGMFLFNGSGQLVGLVQTVNSDTSLTLATPALLAVSGAAYTLQSVRGINPRVVKGEITVSTTVATVTGSNTKFLDQSLNSGTWDVYRASDSKFIGTVATVQSNIGLTLSANGTAAMAEERYFAVKRDGDYGLSTTSPANRKAGFLTAMWADHQWYGNLAQTINGVDCSSRVQFADPDDFEAIDLSVLDGDYIDIPSTGKNTTSYLAAIVPSFNALLCIKDTETWGIFGTSTENFNAKKLLDDGALSGMCAIQYQAGVVWAGREGIYFYDGVQPVNIVLDSLGDYYKTCVRTMDTTTYRAWAMIERDHYILNLERVTPNVPVVKANVSSSPTTLQFVVNLATGAVSTFRNVNLRGAITLPSQLGQGSWFVVNSSTQGYVCKASSLFDSDGIDAVACDGGSAGPDFYMETKRYTLGDAMRKKLFKQFAFQYICAGDSLKVDTVIGLNETGVTSPTELPPTLWSWDRLGLTYTTWDAETILYPTWDSLTEGIYLTKRIKFLKRSQEMAVRIYQKSPAVTKAKFGPWQLGYKLMREGRI